MVEPARFSCSNVVDRNLTGPPQGDAAQDRPNCYARAMENPMSDESAQPTTYPAAWYPDINQPGTERYFDGTAWTDQTRPAFSTPEKPPAKLRKGWIIGGSIAAGVIVLGGALLTAAIAASLFSASTTSSGPLPTVAEAAENDLVSVPSVVGQTIAEGRAALEGLGLTISSPSGTADDAVIATQALSEGREVPPGTEVFVTVESTPEPEAGSLENPFPAGYEVTITSGGADAYSVVFRLIDADAGAALAQANQFNDPAPAGMKYVLIEATFTGLNNDFPTSPGGEMYTWNISDGSQLFQPAFAVTPGESISGAPDLYAGQSFTGQEAYLVPVDAAVLYMSALGSYVAL